MTSMQRLESRPTGPRAAFAAWLAAVALAVAAFAVTGPAPAPLNVDIPEGFVQPPPIALPDLHGEAPEEHPHGPDLMSLVTAYRAPRRLFLTVPQHGVHP